MLNGSLLKKAASLDTTVLRIRSWRNVVLPLIARSAGRNHRTLAVRRATWPSISTGSSSRADQARTTAPSAGSWPVKPQLGSNVSWSMIVWRAYCRASPLRPAVDRRRTADRRPVRQLLAHLDGLQCDIDLGRLPGQIVQLGDGATEHDRRRLERVLGGVRDAAAEPTILEPERRLDERHGDGALGTDRPQRPEPDTPVAHPRRVALEDVKARRGAVAQEVAVRRRGQQRTAREADLYEARVGEKTPR